MWLFEARIPTGTPTPVAWKPIDVPGMISRGSTVRDVWWMAFTTEQAAIKGRHAFKHLNEGQPMRTKLREVSRIPARWQ